MEDLDNGFKAVALDVEVVELGLHFFCVKDFRFTCY